MAEARLGVEPIGVEGDTFDLNTSLPVFQISFEERGVVIFIPRFRDVVRNVVRRVRGALVKMKVAFAPLPLPAVAAAVAGFVGAALYSKNAHWWKWSGLSALLWRIKWPLLKAALAGAFAVAFAVSVAQYLPTLYIGAGRYSTVTTEAVTLASGGQRSLAAAYAWLQWLLPALMFALAAWLGRPRRFAS